MVFHTSIVHLSGGRGTCILSIYAFCYMWNLFGVTLFHTSIVNWGGRCILSICALCYMWHLFGVTVFHRCIVNWRWGEGYMHPQYMCILLYVIVIWCNGIPYIYCQLEWGVRCILSILCILLYVTLIWCNNIPYIYFQLGCWRGYMYPQYMCILPYVKLMWCNGIPEIYCQLERWGRCILSMCSFCYMWYLFGVMVFQRSIVNWSSGGDVSSVCVHSAICESYLV